MGGILDIGYFENSDNEFLNKFEKNKNRKNRNIFLLIDC
jgi:hypothetical protein